MQVKALWASLVNRVKKRALRARRYKAPKVVRNHRLNSHAESVYLWALLDQKFGPETSQEIRQNAINNRGNRSRTNGFVTVDMVLRRGRYS